MNCYESLINMLNIKVDNFDIIKENFSDMHIDYLLSQKESFIDDIENYKIDSHDLELLLKCSILTPEDKISIVNQVSNTLITKNIANQIVEFVYNNVKIPLSYADFDGHNLVIV